MEDDQINAGDIDVILLSLTYSKQYISDIDMQVIPYDIKREKLNRIELIEAKLRELKKELLIM